MRKIWATEETVPHSEDTVAAASAAGASEIVTIPCQAMPDIAPGYHEFPDPVPASVTRLQGRLALLNAGLLSTAESAINAAGGATLIWYQDAQTWERSNPILTDLGTAIGLSSSDIDDLFRQAATLS